MIITLKVFEYRAACYILDGVPLPSMDVSMGDDPNFDPVEASRQDHTAWEWMKSLQENDRWFCPDPERLGELYATNSWGDVPFPHLARHASPNSLLPEGFSDDYFYRYAFNYYPEAVHQLLKEDMAVGLNFRQDGSVSLLGLTTWEGDDYARSSRTPLLLISSSGDYGTLVDLYFGSISTVLKQNGFRPFCPSIDPQATHEKVTQGARQLLEEVVKSYPDLTLVTGSAALGYEGIPNAYKDNCSVRNADAWLNHMGIPTKNSGQRYDQWKYFSDKFGYITLEEWTRSGLGSGSRPLGAPLNYSGPSFQGAGQAFKGVRVPEYPSPAPSPAVSNPSPESGFVPTLKKIFRF